MGETRWAYLPDGRRMDSREYWMTDEWKAVCRARFDFDGGKCVICHAPAQVTHHVDPSKYGHESINDVISLCHTHHHKFHSTWKQNDFWKPEDCDAHHWEAASLEHTAKLCAMYWREDMYLGGEYGNNMCDLSVIKHYIDLYFKESSCMGAIILETDVQLFIRNKRYELWLNSGYSNVLEFLDNQYGKKVRGKNPLRRDAENFYYTKWLKRSQEPDTAMKETYGERESITILMEEAKKYEQAE